MMGTIKKTVGRIFRADYIPFFALFIVMLALHRFCDTLPGDHTQMKIELSTMGGIGGFLKHYINNWASGFLITFIEAIHIKLPVYAWMLVDSCLVVLIAVSFQKIVLALYDFPKKTSLNWVMAAYVMLYPLLDMRSAGWMITTIAYVYPLAFTVAALMPLKKVYAGEKISILGYVAYFICNMIGSNSPQAVLFPLGLYGMFIAYDLVKQKKIRIFFALQFIGSLAWFIWASVSLGNANRFALETTSWWPDMRMYGFIQQVKLSIAATTDNFIQNPNAVFIAFCLLLTLCVWRKYKDAFYRFLSTIPLFFASVSILGSIALYRMFPLLEPLVNFRGGAIPGNVIPLAGSRSLSQYAPLIAQLFVFLLIAVLLYLVFEHTKKTVLMIAVYVISVLTRLEMAFSPTLYASTTRTMIYMYAAFVFIGVAVYAEYVRAKHLNKGGEEYGSL